MRNVGVIGNGWDKFSSETRQKARALIEEILAPNNTVLVSGRSPVGGVDVWSEETQDQLHPGQKLIFAPEVERWDSDPPGQIYGFKARNLDIADKSDVLHIIVAKDYPPGYRGRRWERCYHCLRMGRDAAHCKSGACWTGEQALEMGERALETGKSGKLVVWHVIE